MSDVLTKICNDKRDHVAACKARKTLGTLEAEAKAQSAPRGFINALETSVADGRYGLIAEIKKASPVQGPYPRRLQSAGTGQGL